MDSDGCCEYSGYVFLKDGWFLGPASFCWICSINSLSYFIISLFVFVSPVTTESTQSAKYHSNSTQD
jgi:hypothetical protein